MLLRRIGRDEMAEEADFSIAQWIEWGQETYGPSDRRRGARASGLPGHATSGLLLARLAPLFQKAEAMALPRPTSTWP